MCVLKTSAVKSECTNYPMLTQGVQIKAIALSAILKPLEANPAKWYSTHIKL